jgi:ribonuclease P protein component
VTHHPRPDRVDLHVAYAIGRPVGTAVTRNRVRRRLRAALVALDREGLTPAGGDLLVSARPRAADASFAQLLGHLRATLAGLADGGRS